MRRSPRTHLELRLFVDFYLSLRCTAGLHWWMTPSWTGYPKRAIVNRVGFGVWGGTGRNSRFFWSPESSWRATHLSVVGWNMHVSTIYHYGACCYWCSPDVLLSCQQHICLTTTLREMVRTTPLLAPSSYFQEWTRHSYTREFGFPEVSDIITQFNHLHEQQTHSRLDVPPGPIAVLPPIFCPPLLAHWSVPSVCTLTFVSNWFENDLCPNESCHMFEMAESHINECIFGVERAKRFLERRAVAGDSNLKGI